MTKKSRYPQECARHPKQHKNLKYVYTGPYHIGGKYCRECRDEIESSEGEVLAVWADES